MIFEGEKKKKKKKKKKKVSRVEKKREGEKHFVKGPRVPAASGSVRVSFRRFASFRIVSAQFPEGGSGFAVAHTRRKTNRR